jgi:hypothetical protein
MYKIKPISRLFILAAVLIASVTSCEKENENQAINDQENTTTVKDDAIASNLYDEVFQEVDQALTTNSSQFKSTVADTCKTITIEKLDSNKRRVTINFGDGCEGNLGRIKKGKIITIASGRYREKGFSREITFDNFYINDYKIEGTKYVLNEGTNSNNKLTFSIHLENGKIITPGGKEITREFERTRTWIKGSDTPWFIWDDEYNIIGTANGVNRNDYSYTRTITDSLYITLGCGNIRSGIIEIVREDKPLINVDYGDGACDNKATITVNDQSWEVSL